MGDTPRDLVPRSDSQKYFYLVREGQSLGILGLVLLGSSAFDVCHLVFANANGRLSLGSGTRFGDISEADFSFDPPEAYASIHALPAKRESIELLNTHSNSLDGGCPAYDGEADGEEP